MEGEGRSGSAEICGQLKKGRPSGIVLYIIPRLRCSLPIHMLLGWTSHGAEEELSTEARPALAGGGWARWRFDEGKNCAWLVEWICSGLADWVLDESCLIVMKK